MNLLKHKGWLNERFLRYVRIRNILLKQAVPGALFLPYHTRTQRLRSVPESVEGLLTKKRLNKKEKGKQTVELVAITKLSMLVKTFSLSFPK